VKERPTCVTGCGTPVRRTGAHCTECRKRLRAAQARARRGADLLPVVPGATAQRVLDRIQAARDALDRLEAAREHAERVRELHAMPYPEVDLWTRAIRAELIGANDALAEWALTARDIERRSVPRR